MNGSNGGTSVWHRRALAAGFLAVWACASAAGSLAQDWPHAIERIPVSNGPLTIRQHAEAAKPFTVAGPCGAVLGEQNGNFEAWVFPVKLLSHFTIRADVDGYNVPIDVNNDAAEIEVAPDHTTITFSHIAFTLRETLFATRCAQNGAGVMALFELDSARPVTLTFSFTPEVRRMWPAPNYGVPAPEWVKTAGGGYYILHEDVPEIAGAVAMPGTEPGILAPYQEKPKTYPLQLVLKVDPKRDAGKAFPLLMAVGNSAETATNAALAKQLQALNAQAETLYRQNADYYAHFFDHRLTVETPDEHFNQAMRWAEVAIDQTQVRHGDETGMVAGFYSSGDSARPGFGWFFGRDTLYTLFGVNSYGDFALTRRALEFLIKRQRADGKMMHEYSQTAEFLNWSAFPYEYAAADATPLFLMVMEDYVNASGDKEFLQRNWASVEKAWEFESTHDSDGDGIYDNAQGTGWVESWPPGMPHQEVYLAALDQQASGAMARLSAAMGKTENAQAAENRAKAVAAKIEAEYAGETMYAFSRNPDGSADKTATVYPSIAWWDGHYALKQSGRMFSRWASSEFSTDWGLRDLGEHEALYDPISYHQGSVWPLFTGWTSLAEYRAGRPLAGYTHLMQNANLTWAQDLGSVTELLSGAYFVPFGRSSSHQMWSSAMVVTPAIRGLFGVSFDAPGKTVRIAPQLPPEWDGATLHNLPVNGGVADLVLAREHGELVATLRGAPAGTLLAGADGTGGKSGGGASALRLPLPAYEVGVPTGLPLPGSVTAQLKVIGETRDAHSLTLELEGQGGTLYTLPLRINDASRKARAEGAEVPAEKAAGLATLRVTMPAGSGYQHTTVRLTW